MPRMQPIGGKSAMTIPLIKHCEDHLGSIVSGWSRDAAGTPLSVQVALFESSPLPGVQVLCTLGLSNVPLCAGGGTLRLRQELVAMFRETDGPRNLPAILQQLATEALSNDAALVLGDVIGPRGELRTGATVSALYTALPVYLPDSFHVCRSTPEPVVFGWMVPITDAEAVFARTRGRDAFESLLESVDPDLLHTSRASMV
ncbi:MAG: suppressor of fused domain protein [Kofleriaceae bacterium]